MAQFNSRRRSRAPSGAPTAAEIKAERGGATKQTVARAKSDPFPDLIAAGLLPANSKSLASDLAEAYRLRTPGCGYGTTGVHGASVDTLRSEALQLAWAAWAKTIFSLTFIQPHVYVEWAIGIDRVLDRHAAPSMATALSSWSVALGVAWKRVRPEGQQAA